MSTPPSNVLVGGVAENPMVPGVAVVPVSEPLVMANSPAVAALDNCWPFWSSNVKPPWPFASTVTEVMMFAMPVDATSRPVVGSIEMPEIVPRTAPAVVTVVAAL